MVFNTLSVGAAVAPAVIETAFSHYLNRKPLHEKPTAHISYHEGLSLVRQFLDYAAHHTVDDVQTFTAQWVPTPRWVKVDEITIPETQLNKAGELLNEQLGHKGIDKIGGKTWWQWRQEDALKAEWIEMRKDYHERKAASNTKGDRIILYVHGGAYFFGSVDEHRYQMQRHARKLKARVLAPRYRLAPQYPFPCGLHDCIAAYLYLLAEHDPSTILLAGDSAGGGMVVSMLVTLRDQSVPLPAGAILLSPWVDLTHSFPSVAGDDSLDYIPSNGFHQRPSMSWPPPNSADMKHISMGAVQKLVDAERKGLHAHGKEKDEKQKEHERKEEEEEEEAVQGFTVDENPGDRDEVANKNNPASPTDPDTRGGNTIPGPGHNLSIMLDGNMVELIDQIQMYTTNQLLAHPLVSPIMQSSLGGLPPLLIQTGGGELLRDEQIYLAHKAADPNAYPPSDIVLDEYDPHREMLNKYPPTDVQLQVWEDLCHVPHTLSFTRPAKYMYRGVAQFGAWAYANAQKKANEQLEDDDAQSFISTGSETGSPSSSTTDLKSTMSRDAPKPLHSTGTMDVDAAIGAPHSTVGRAGDPIPPFKHHMIRQRVTRHGVIFSLAPPSEIPALHLDPSSIGVIKAGPVRKWLARKSEWDTKFKREKRNVQKQRVKEIAQGYDIIGDEETPPPTALAGRRRKDMPKIKQRKGKSWGLAMWSGWGSKHDETTIENEKDGGKRRGSAGRLEADPSEAEKRGRQMSSPGTLESNQDLENGNEHKTSANQQTDTTRDTEIGGVASAGTAAAGAAAIAAKNDDTMDPNSTERGNTRESAQEASQPDVSDALQAGEKVEGSDNTFLSPTSSRPHNGTVAYPFKLRNRSGMGERNASTFTLESTHEVQGMKRISVADGGSADINGASSPPDNSSAQGNGAPSEGESDLFYFLGKKSKDAESTSAAKPEPATSEGVTGNGIGTSGKEKVVENGEVKSVAASRPPLESFVTAQEF